MKSVALHNLGCKVNSYEIEVMQQMLQEKGYTIVPFDETADIYIVNTCTVTNIADRKRIFTGSGTGRCGGGECRKCRAWCGQDSA